jgi:hypothetical protein
MDVCTCHNNNNNKKVLDIRFEECGDATLGLVLCPTRFGLEVSDNVPLLFKTSNHVYLSLSLSYSFGNIQRHAYI